MGENRKKIVCTSEGDITSYVNLVAISQQNRYYMYKTDKLTVTSLEYASTFTKHNFKWVE